MKGMDEMEIYHIWFNELRGVPLYEKKILLALLGDPKAIYDRTEKELKELLDLWYFSEPQHKKTSSSITKDLDPAWRIYEGNQLFGIKILTFEDPLYRVRANSSVSSPLLLYYRGKLQNANIGTVGIVGSRKATAHGKRAARLACQQIKGVGGENENLVVISGLSEGINAVVHEDALSQDRVSYAFTAQGLASCQSHSLADLMSRIVEVGAVLSPFPLGTHLRSYQYPKSNAVMAAWMDELVVIEARAASGVLSLARSVMHNGSVVRVVPGNVFLPNCKGSNQLFLEGAQAFIPDINETAEVTGLRQGVIDLLIDMALTTQELSDKLGLGLSEVEAELMEMEMDDAVQYRADGRWHSLME